MKIAITGGTGFVGKALVKEFLQKGHEVFVLTRSLNKKAATQNFHYVPWLSSNCAPEQFIDGVDVFINLAGEPINAGRWTDERKKRILGSRIHATEAVLDILRKVNNKPRVLINASAIGIYGSSTSKTFTESDHHFGSDFLAHTVKEWESKANLAAMFGIRVVSCRFGIILDKNEGALPRMALPYKFFAGGTVGSGKQWVSWIHLEDVIRGIEFVIKKEEICGPVNFTAPQPVSMKELGQSLAKTLNKPHWIPAPAFVLKIVLGEMSTLILEGQRVLPDKLSKNGFQYSFPSLNHALNDIFS